MARIDFAFGASDRLRAACDTVRKHYLAGRHLIVYTQDVALLKRFDLLLWGFEATAFIPHVYHDDTLAAQTPVVLYNSPPIVSHGDTPWLLNLDPNCPPTAGQFERILEIVSTNENDIQAARQRWVDYKTEGHDLHAHDISPRN